MLQKYNNFHYNIYQIDILIFKETNVNVYYNDFISRIQNHGDGSNGLVHGYNDSIINIDN